VSVYSAAVYGEIRVPHMVSDYVYIVPGFLPCYVYNCKKHSSNNNANNYDSVYGAVIMTKVILQW